jgi:dihydrofolate reductase
MSLSLIVAMTRRGVIGRGGGLPWRLSDDLKRFKALTMGHHVLMGRKTFDSLPRPLAGRTLIVLTRHSTPVSASNPQQAFVAPSLDEALRLAASDSEVFVIGGAEIFALALPRVEKMYVTWVEGEVEGDVTFPQTDWSQWRETSVEQHAADEKNKYRTTFCVYERMAAV